MGWNFGFASAGFAVPGVAAERQVRLRQENRELVKRWNGSRKQDTATRHAALANWSTVEARRRNFPRFC